MIKLNKIYNDDCINFLPKIDSDTINICIFSPPYNVGIPYLDYNDNIPFDDYKKFTLNYLSELYRVGKDDCRYCINIPYEVNMHDNGNRILFLSEYYELCKSIGFKFSGVIDLHEVNPNRPKNSAWGSWLSASAPYCYNPKECVLILYKKTWKRESKGVNYFSDFNKNEFIKLVQGVWRYRPETRKLTEANYSLDIPMNALKLFSYENDIVLDIFSGAGTTAFACKLLNRQYIGIELSKSYYEFSLKRLNEPYVELNDEPNYYFTNI